MRTNKYIATIGIVNVVLMMTSIAIPVKVSAKATNPVTVYADPNFLGVSQELSLGEHDISELTGTNGVGNDKISSIRISSGYRVTLYENKGFGGSTSVLTANNAWIDFDDKTSSIKIEYAPTHLPVTLYSDIDLGGTAQEMDLGNHDWADLTVSGGVGNDKISSLRVAPGYKVTLYKDANYKGSSIEVTADRMYIGDGWNDEISSLKVEKISPLDSTCIPISSWNDTTKLELLERFAPRIWMAEGESYQAASVEWALPHLVRYYNDDTKTYCFKTAEEMTSAITKLNYFHGNQSEAKAYSFWTEKDYNNIDLSYWQYTTYDQGKVVVGSQFGAHVSDWEHITVRLTKFTYNGTEYVKPVAVVFPYHAWQSTYNWDEVDKVSGTDHIIAYSAKGSHGMWKDSYGLSKSQWRQRPKMGK